MSNLPFIILVFISILAMLASNVLLVNKKKKDDRSTRVIDATAPLAFNLVAALGALGALGVAAFAILGVATFAITDMVVVIATAVATLVAVLIGFSFLFGAIHFVFYKMANNAFYLAMIVAAYATYAQ